MKKHMLFAIITTCITTSTSLAYDFNNIHYKISELDGLKLKINYQEFQVSCLDYQKQLQLNASIIDDCKKDGPASLACLKLENIRTGDKSAFGNSKKFILSVPLDQDIEYQNIKNSKNDFLNFEVSKVDYDAEFAVFNRMIYQPDSESKKIMDAGLRLYPAKIELGNQGAEILIFSRELACDLYSQKVSLEFEAPLRVVLNSDQIKSKIKLVNELQEKILEKDTDGLSTIQATVSATSRIYSHLLKQKNYTFIQGEIEALIHQLFPLIFKNDKLELRKPLSNNEQEHIIPKDVITYEKARIKLY